MEVRAALFGGRYSLIPGGWRKVTPPAHVICSTGEAPPGRPSSLTRDIHRHASHDYTPMPVSRSDSGRTLCVLLVTVSEKCLCLFRIAALIACWIYAVFVRPLPTKGLLQLELAIFKYVDIKFI